ncbi:MAG TPA: hypothetical protein VGR62_18130 [Candidatus Binatia bacterium]|jgi:DNA-binding beta-propeller fold protein YncE|nr:hypothetical protein [Candidatus Binatia bacterium]
MRLIEWTRNVAVCLTACLAIAMPHDAGAQPSFVEFESGQVRPLALTPDGGTLLAVNTPDNRLEIFAVSIAGLEHIGSVPVGMEPVAVAARTNTEVWVVNHLSDSISIVDIGANPPRVTRTLLVGDEPRDIVFAGPSRNRAFITTAHRGQQRTDASIAAVPGAGDPQLITAGVGRADVWIFDGTSLGTALGGVPLRIMTLFADTPRALAVSTDGNTVYAAGFHSGNQTATVSEGVVCDGFAGAAPCTGDGITSPGGLAGGQRPGGNPGPTDNVQGVGAPEVGLIVKWNKTTNRFEDELGRNWNNGLRFTLPDRDVFAINATTLSEIASHVSVGTTLFNMVVNPVTGDLYVSNTEARNEVRFEGPGFVGNSTVQGHLAESRVTVIDTPNVSGSAVKPRHLNKHINYSILANEPGFDTSAKVHSLATPTDMVVDSTGATLYVAAFGSSRIGVFSTTALEANTFNPTTASASYLGVSGGGPSGLALDELNDRLYVLTRFDNGVSVIDLSTGIEADHIALHNPEPNLVVEGRPFLYDAFNTSANGEASCSSCHIFGDMDDLAWDLGNPDDVVTQSPMAIKLTIGADAAVNGEADIDEFHPMKGPMTTQTLRGMSNSGPMHWRGDRSNGFFGVSTDEATSFNNFIVAFSGLVGRSNDITPAEMQKFTDFALAITLPPNPVRAINNVLTADQQAGRDFYNGSRRADGIAAIPNLGFNCNGCHTLDASQGFFGTNGDASFENEEQILKIAHLRNLYQKVGMFGLPVIPFLNAGNNGFQGDQVRGFGFLHDGSIDTVFRFFQATVFNNSNGVGFDGASGGDVKRRQMEQFIFAFDTDLAPVVGQQVTLTNTNAAVAGPRIDLLIARSAAAFTSKVLGGAVTECNLIVKGTLAGEARGWRRTPGGTFQSDKAAEVAVSDAALRTVAATAGQALTYTCAPPGSGLRMGIDQDEDAVLDGDDNCPSVSNPTQTDTDLDGIGDACDTGPTTTTTSSTSTTSTSSTSTSTSTTSSTTSTSTSTSSTTSTSAPTTTTTSSSSTTSSTIATTTSTSVSTSTTSTSSTTTSSSTTSSSTTTTTTSPSTTSSSTSTTSTSSTTTSSTSTTTLPPVGCRPAPRTGCVVSGRATVAFNEKSAGYENMKVILRNIIPGVARTQFGDPVAGSTRYDVCVHAQSGALVGELTVNRAGQNCGSKPCWRTAGAGYRYVDTASSADGVGKMLLKGAAPGKGSVTVKGGNKASKGQTSLPTGIASGLQAPNAQATVQVVSDDGICVEAVLTTITKNTALEFSAKKP